MVMNTPDGNTISTAQLAMSLLCNMARKIPTANISIKQGQWNPKKFQGAELQGKTIGIIGCGRIGQVVAKLSKTMGMKVVGYDPMMSSEMLATDFGILGLSLENLLKISDFITIHTPLTTETRNLLNDETLRICKHGVGLVNCARGGIIEEEALLRALESGQVGSAALDVFTTEPPKENMKTLLQHSNLVCTPHLGASTEEAQINVARDIAQQMCDVFDQKEVQSPPLLFLLRRTTHLPLLPPPLPSSAVVHWYCQCSLHCHLYLALHEAFHVPR
jgi:D-3-phosphoglycerate dehydrogenase / 2-oxoglutarate reductase